MRSFPWSQWDTAAMWAYIVETGGRVQRATRIFVEKWIELAEKLPSENAPFDDCVISQERANKRARARLRADNRAEKVAGWIGIEALAYRLPQAWRIVNDIHQAESGKGGGHVGV